MSNNLQLEKQRGAAVAQMRALFALADSENRIMNPTEAARFDKLGEDVNAIDQKLGAKDPATEAFLARMSQTQKPPLQDIGGFIAGPSENWVDQTGNPVKVYAKAENLCTKQPEVGLGDIVKAMIGAPVSREVRASMTEGSNSAGGYLTNADLARYVIDKLRAKSQMVNAGMRTTELSTLTTYVARIISDAVPVWHSEGSDDLLSNNPTFDHCIFTARTLGCVLQISKELAADAYNFDQVVVDNLTKSLAAEIDRACLLGDGSGAAPVGLLHYPSVGVTNLNAAPNDWTPITNAVGSLLTANAGMPTAVILHPKALMAFNNLQDSLKQPLRRPEVISNLPLLDCGKIPTNDPEGSPVVNDGTALYVGDFSQTILGVRAELELQILRERFATSGCIGIGAWMRVDFQCQHPESVQIVKGGRV
jgi:HK97 family phage major capsid protein